MTATVFCSSHRIISLLCIFKLNIVSVITVVVGSTSFGTWHVATIHCKTSVWKRKLKEGNFKFSMRQLTNSSKLAAVRKS
jgi:hypothetical protein